MSGDHGWCSTISKMQCLSEFNFREVRSIDLAWWVCNHLSVSWLLRMVRLVADGIGSLNARIAVFAAAMVWVCLAVSKVVSSFSALMRWLQTSLLAW